MKRMKARFGIVWLVPIVRLAQGSRDIANCRGSVQQRFAKADFWEILANTPRAQSCTIE